MTRPRNELVNIGPREREIRRTLGLGLLGAVVVLFAVLLLTGASRWWSLVTFPLLYQGVRFLLDHRTGTDPLKAELGQEKLDGAMTIFGTEIHDVRRAMRIRAISRRALLEAVLLALAGTLTAFLLLS